MLRTHRHTQIREGFAAAVGRETAVTAGGEQCGLVVVGNALEQIRDALLDGQGAIAKREMVLAAPGNAGARAHVGWRGRPAGDNGAEEEHRV